MDDSFIRKRISELRMEKHISEYKNELRLRSQQKLCTEHFVRARITLNGGVFIYL